MEQNNLDILKLLKAFAQKKGSPEIEIESFVQFIDKNAEKGANPSMDAAALKRTTRENALKSLKELAAEKKIDLISDKKEQKIIVNGYYLDMINKYYTTDDSLKNGRPFPDEALLNIRIPNEKLRVVSAETGLLDYMNEPHEDPNQIVKIVFPNTYGNVFTLASQYPKKILELGILMIGSKLKNSKDKDYFIQKLCLHYKGLEGRVRSFVNMLISQPAEAMSKIEESSEFTYSIWSYICILIKKQAEESAYTKDNLYENLGFLQASIIVAIVNNYYQVFAINKRNSASTLSEVYEKMLYPPFYFTIGDISQFTNQFNQPLNAKYAPEDFNNFIIEKTSFSDEGELPDIFKFKIKSDHDIYVRKDRAWRLATKFLVEAYGAVKTDIVQKWTKKLTEWEHDKAMNSDIEFENLIERSCNLFSPYFLPIIRDKKMAVLQEEIANELPSAQTPQKNEKFFDGGKPIPLRIIFGFRKENFLNDCKLKLPFWYSIGIIYKIIRVFKQNKKTKKASVKMSESKKTTEKKDMKKMLEESAVELVRNLVPEGRDIDKYLTSIAERWNQLIDPAARKNLIIDVQALVKAHMNQILKIQKPSSFDDTMLDENSERIIKMNSALGKIHNKAALQLYIKVYITKLLLNINK